VEEIADLHARGTPGARRHDQRRGVGALSRLLKRQGIPHSVLTRIHQQEAGIVSQAGRRGAVTIATNMAGRGTRHQARERRHPLQPRLLRGLASTSSRVSGETSSSARRRFPAGSTSFGTERHESRRIDRQLRGRSGRQGDPGSSRFFLSLEDD